MTYIPKSLVNSSLYTGGGEFINPSTGKCDFKAKEATLAPIFTKG